MFPPIKKKHSKQITCNPFLLNHKTLNVWFRHMYFCVIYTLIGHVLSLSTFNFHSTGILGKSMIVYYIATVLYLCLQMHQ